MNGIGGAGGVRRGGARTFPTPPHGVRPCEATRVSAGGLESHLRHADECAGHDAAQDARGFATVPRGGGCLAFEEW